MVKQISVFLENKAGRLASVTRVLGDAGINIRALSIADTSDFGVLRLIVNDPDKAYRILKEAGFTVSQTDVVAVSVPDRPGGLAEILEVMAEADINIEYLYAFIGTTARNALVIFKVEDVEKTTSFFKDKGIKFLGASEIYSL
ncbi:MAG TPA: ACT domain-containing protein [Syntrophothermus lipocalidus]|uniref:Amino acid-binding ACT domain protein n=1 Tax=Syntrophothermus lipocalidus (strain DSM 12680 / TGB-C1) TaxID=643648 RepID=D7CLH4_SYNLT|nr:MULTISPECIES: ACT domain-containing protein [Syntrophothermus]ADI01559.1 amino acid-binding ACT domain protein [Syntrophothermus lipocalidus DSM 12680]NSW83754.1 ACT domain-containing protein [Syntrophothermus sp.]HHV76956.1 ACT domain-containing protein [Syntrophothermus lipocalidus]